MTNLKLLAIEILEKDYETRNELIKELSLSEKYKLEVIMESNFILNQVH